MRQNFSLYIFFSLRIKKKNKVSGGKTHFAHTYLSLSSQVANKSMQELFPFARFLNNTLPIYVEERTSITRQNILLTTKIFRSACMLSAHSKYQKIQGLLLCRKLSSLCFKLHVAMKIVLPNHQIPFLFLALWLLLVRFDSFTKFYELLYGVIHRVKTLNNHVSLPA